MNDEVEYHCISQSISLWLNISQSIFIMAAAEKRCKCKCIVVAVRVCIRTMATQSRSVLGWLWCRQKSPNRCLSVHGFDGNGDLSAHRHVASEIVDGDIVEGGRTSCWLFSNWVLEMEYYLHCQGWFRQRRFINNSRRSTSLVIIVHNNKPPEDGWTEISRINVIKKRGDNRINSNSRIRLFIKVLWPNQ
jgi:hypothetical protein